MADTHGRIDILFVNAGVAGYVPVGQVTEEFFDRMFNLNVRGAYLLMQEAARVMPQGGSIVLTASIAHAMQCQTHRSMPPARRPACTGQDDRRRIGRSRHSGQHDKSGPHRHADLDEDNGRNRPRATGYGEPDCSPCAAQTRRQPEDIAAAALFLASSEASFITGIDLPVDGGVMELGFGG